MINMPARYKGYTESTSKFKEELLKEKYVKDFSSYIINLPITKICKKANISFYSNDRETDAYIRPKDIKKFRGALYRIVEELRKTYFYERTEKRNNPNRSNINDILEIEKEPSDNALRQIERESSKKKI